MVLPVIAISMLSAAYIARVTRASVLEVLNQDYIRTARAKGLREYAVVVAAHDQERDDPRAHGDGPDVRRS